ncbi:hypothetical protein KY290_001783 [Solanum tuberosum]|uniref:NIF system FeS cluster assembly NifU C-terminal domain-containing protein n=3 Tax=Solanum tuberosum TaxID=4113 RepID=A0ABQ7WN88_SOLTU|nr:PREDICTED: nifU-like protein 1, chloroplastic [Solanum tuberosum]KAH0782185.1 hypothetical protein KY290_001783 [Solanum tuberosum]
MAHIAAMGVSQISSSIYMPELPLKSQNLQPSSVFLKRFSVAHKRFNLVKATVDGSPSPGLYSAKQFELTPENVDMVLEDVRPYLISDGGNVEVVSVEDGVVSLQLQGACESCPSATTTMKMGIEKVLKEKFGEAIKDIRQVYNEQVVETTAEAVNAHLDILRPAIKNFGGSVEVLSVEEGNCNVKYVGPESIGSGVKAAIKEKFPDIVNVVFTD